MIILYTGDVIELEEAIEWTFVLQRIEVLAEKITVLLYMMIKNNLFYVVEGRDLTYLNDKLLRESSELHDRDIIQIGNTKLEFVAFCKGERKWN